MCGIAGHFHANLKSEQLKFLCNQLAHRGPDSEGIYWDQAQNVALCHRRLSIIDLSDAAAQPFKFENLVLSFNGELYNFREVRATLMLKGYTFQSDSDTEVLIKAFHCWREHSLEKFTGMFAFAVYDRDSGELFLCRDRLGVKPLYIARGTAGGYIFTSELKAIYGLRNYTIDNNSLCNYFRFGYIGRDRSIFNEVKTVKPGTYVRIGRDERIEEKHYWIVRIRDGDEHRTDDDWADELEDLIIKGFKYRMVADVPVGVFLSGGIDSSLVTAVLQKHCGNISTFTIGFREDKYNEAPFAREVSARLGTNHHERLFTIERANEALSRFYQIYDEPFSDLSGLPVSLVSETAREAKMKVVLSADGGDELFGGYPHYLRALRAYEKMRLMPGFVRHSVSRICNAFPEHWNLRWFNLRHRAAKIAELLNINGIEFYESFVSNLTGSELTRLVPQYLPTTGEYNSDSITLSSMMNWDLHNYLPDDLLVKVDRATMYHSLESREPFLDHTLVEFASRLPERMKVRNGRSKFILRKVLSRYLPDELFNRPKMGFSIPLFDWFSGHLDHLFESYLTPENVKSTGVLNEAEVREELINYYAFKKKGKAYNMEKMWRLLSFVWWHHTWYRSN